MAGQERVNTFDHRLHYLLDVFLFYPDALVFLVLTVVTLIRFALRQGSWHCSRVHIGPHAQLLLRQPAEHAITGHDMTCSRVWLVGGLQTNISMQLSCPRCSNVNVKVLLITYLAFLRAAHGPVSTMKPLPVQPFCQSASSN